MHKTASALALLAASGAFALANTGPAGAAAKQRVVVDRFSEDYEFAIDCGEFGPYEFDNEVVGHERIAVTDVLAADGTLLQTVFNLGLSETDTNSVSGETLRLKGAISRGLGLCGQHAHHQREGVVRDRSRRRRGDPGRRPHHDDPRHDEALFLAGPHSVFFSGGIDPVVCARLAG